MLPVAFTPLLAEGIGVPGKELRFQLAISNPRAEYMVLMNTIRKLSIPNPSAAKLVTVSPFIEENVASLQAKLFDLVDWRANHRDTVEIEVSTLDICHA